MGCMLLASRERRPALSLDILHAQDGPPANSCAASRVNVSQAKAPWKIEESSRAILEFLHVILKLARGFRKL